jgi:hypothetical protein
MVSSWPASVTSLAEHLAAVVLEAAQQAMAAAMKLLLLPARIK